MVSSISLNNVRVDGKSFVITKANGSITTNIYIISLIIQLFLATSGDMLVHRMPNCSSEGYELGPKMEQMN